VILVDTNVLLYAINEDDPRHDVSRAFLEHALDGHEPVGFSWVVLLAFLRLATKPGLFPNPWPVDEALDLIGTWLDLPAAVVVEPTPRHFGLLAGLLAPSGTGGNLTSDAHLAALALEHHATIVTFDGDFGRFPGVRWRAPRA
jgi:toxin-antitoxin system PIN domain toxin